MGRGGSKTGKFGEARRVVKRVERQELGKGEASDKEGARFQVVNLPDGRLRCGVNLTAPAESVQR